MRTAFCVAILFTLALPQGTSAGEGLLAGHSLTSPPDINALASDWFLGGTVIPSTKSLVLNPGAPNRLGMIWSNYQLLTGDFEVALRLKITAPETRTAKDEGFAFWFVQDNGTAEQFNITNDQVQNQDVIIANTFDVAMEAAGFDLLGYKSKFNGVGVFFTSEAAGGAVCSAASNDGTKDMKLGSGIPSGNEVKIDRSKEIAANIRVKSKEVKVEVVGQGSLIVNTADYKSGYIGLTVTGGKKGVPEHTEKADFVELLEMKVTNYDKTAKGEDMPQPSSVVIPQKPKEEKEDVLAASSSFRDHRAESDAIKVLTNMVFKLVSETKPMQSQLTSALDSLGKRITAMEKTFENLKSEIDKKTGHHLGAEFDAIKKELSSLSSAATTETEERHKRLESLHADIKDVHKTAKSGDNIDHHLTKLTQSNQRTLDNLNNEHQRMFGISIAAIAFVVIAGLSLYNKFRCWEKKHVL